MNRFHTKSISWAQQLTNLDNAKVLNSLIKLKNLVFVTPRFNMWYDIQMSLLVDAIVNAHNNVRVSRSHHNVESLWKTMYSRINQYTSVSKTLHNAINYSG